MAAHHKQSVAPGDLLKLSASDGGSGGALPPPEELSLEELPEEEPEFHHRHGTWKTATMHIITAVIGAGVLTLPTAVSWLGWVGGLLCLLGFAAITLYTSHLLASCYFVRGKRNRTYMETVRCVFGRRGAITIGSLQYVNLFLAAIAFNIIGGLVIQAIACMSRGQEAGCSVLKQWQAVLIFAAGQLVLSQMPSLDESWVASAVGAVMSFSYSCITLGLSIDKVADGSHHGSITGRQGTGTDDKVFGVFNSFGTIVFAYGFSLILIEIQDTLGDAPKGWRPADAQPSRLKLGLSSAASGSRLASLASAERSLEAGPPAAPGTAASADEEKKGVGGADLEAAGSCRVLVDDRQRWQVLQMRKAISFAMTFITFFFVSIAIFGYLAFGDTPCGFGGNILSCFDKPNWLLILTNCLVLVHIFPAYQVFTQPVFGFLEGAIRRSPRFPAAASSRPAIVAGRCIYVVVVAVLAMCLPFFNDMVGLVGAIAFWPATVSFPVEMYIRLYKPVGRLLVGMRIVSAVCFAITACAIIGSIEQIAANASTYQFFS